MTRAESYSNAVFELLRADMEAEKVFKNLKTLLKKRGEMKMLRSILKQVSRKTIELEKRNTSAVRIYAEKDMQHFRTQIEKELDRMNAPRTFRIIEDPTVIGGYSITANEKQLDRTYKKRLLHVYQSVIY